MSKEQQPLDVLFKELEGHIEESQFKKAIRTCNKILAGNQADIEALQCKVICYMQLSSFQEAVDTINKAQPAQKESLVFEKAYSLYSLNKYPDALKEVQVSQKSNKLLELEAQIYYKLENYEKTISIYEQLLSQPSYAGNAELITNLAAVYVDAGRLQECQELVSKNKPIMTKTYELAYNAACLSLAKGDIKGAETQLKLSKKVCIDTLTKDGYSQEDIEEETVSINVQLAYCQQMTGSLENALEIYNNILEKDVGGSGVIVAQNNIAALKSANGSNTHQATFDQLKNVFSDVAEAKLTASQKKIINLNHCIILLQLKKVSQCEELIKSLKQKNKEIPNFKEFNEDLDLICSYLFMRDKKWREAEDILKKNKSLKSQLTLAQLYLQENQLEKTMSVLQGLDSNLQSKPGIIATKFVLYEKLGDYEKAIFSLDSHINQLETSTKDQESLIDLLKLSANLKMKHQKYKEAAETYDRVLTLNPNDLMALPSYIVATSHFNPSLSKKYESKLPNIKFTNTGIDVDKIESQGLAYIKADKKAAALAAAAAAVKPTNNKKKSTVVATEAPKKKPRRLPKNYDPTRLPDPERWLPKWQRAKNRRAAAAKGKGKAADTLSRGSQGVSSSTASSQLFATGTKSTQSSDHSLQKVAETKPRNINKKKNNKKK